MKINNYVDLRFRHVGIKIRFEICNISENQCSILIILLNELYDVIYFQLLIPENRNFI